MRLCCEGWSPATPAGSSGAIMPYSSSRPMKAVGAAGFHRVGGAPGPLSETGPPDPGAPGRSPEPPRPAPPRPAPRLTAFRDTPGDDTRRLRLDALTMLPTEEAADMDG